MGAVLLITTPPTLAAVETVNLGTGVPPKTLGGYSLAQFFDSTPLGGWVTEVTPPATSPVSGTLQFDIALEHLQVGLGWASWSHGYSGDVYWFDELVDGNILTLTLPLETKAFHLYLEPDFDAGTRFSVRSGLESVTFEVPGMSGASGIGFYTDDPDESLVSIVIEKVSLDFTNGFGVGEFGINTLQVIPEGTRWALWAGVLMTGIFARRHTVRR